MLKMLIATGLVATAIGSNIPVPIVRHLPEQQLHFSNWLDKGDKLTVNRPRPDLWLLNREAIRLWCVMSQCRWQQSKP